MPELSALRELREAIRSEKLPPKAMDHQDALEEFIKDKPDFEMRKPVDGKPCIFVHSHQKYLDCTIDCVTSFYNGKKYQRSLVDGNQGCLFDPETFFEDELGSVGWLPEK